MSEEEYFEQLCSNSIDGTLTEAEREKLAAHLAECPSCAALQRDLQQMHAYFAEEAEMPEELHGRIMESIRAEKKGTVVQPEKPRRRLPVFSMVAAAAVVVLVVLGGGLGQMFGVFDVAATSGSAASAEAASADIAESDMQAAFNGASASDAAADSSAAVSMQDAAGSDMEIESESDAGAAEAPENGAKSVSGGAQKSMEAPSGITDTQNSAEITTAADDGYYPVSPPDIPEALRTTGVSHCYLAVGTGDLPELDGTLLTTGEDFSCFLMNGGMETMQSTLKLLEDAGYEISAYEDIGLTMDSRAEHWALFVLQL